LATAATVKPTQAGSRADEELAVSRQAGLSKRRGGHSGHAARERAFLAAVAERGSILGACKKIGMERRMHYDWLEQIPGYPERFAAALAAFEDKMMAKATVLEQAAIDRAIEGAPEFIPNPHTGIAYDSKGKPIVQRKFNEQLTIALLKAHKPEKYGDSSKVEITGAGGKPLFSKPELNVVLVKEVLSTVDFRSLPSPALQIIEGEAAEVDSPTTQSDTHIP
jgi:hypothetical protein